MIPPVSGGSNRHRLTAPKGRIPPCVFFKRPEKSLARCPQVRRLPCGFFIILPLERFVKSILPFLPLHTRRDSACSPPPANQARQPHVATNPHLPKQQKLPPCPRHAQKAKQNSASQVAGTWGKFSVSEGGLEGESPIFQEGALSLQGLPFLPPDHAAGAFGGANAATRTESGIDYSEIVCNVNRTRRTVLFADFATDATRVAYLAYHSAALR